MENNVNNAEELFLNVRKSIRLLYDYKHRVQGTMFYIKQLLNLNPSSRIEVNKLFSNSPQGSQFHGQFQLSRGNWAWDFLFPMAMEYYLGDKQNADKDHWFGMSVIVVTDNGFFKAAKENTAARKEDIDTFANVGSSDTIALFVMEICREGEGSDWTERWERNYMELSLEKWLNDGRDTIADKTEFGNDFIVMKSKLSELVTKENIDHVLNEISNRIKNITGYTVY